MSSLQLPSLLFLGIWIQEVDIHFAVFVLPNQREAEALDENDMEGGSDSRTGQ